ncbi:MAG TPA: hypothetical protein VFQ53_14570 [Kofleriaceae bacterium]|nr:hypothetical protein [Kofleriaceae bacterium]
MATQVIALLAVDAEAVLPQLAQALADPDVVVRVAVLDALHEFGTAAAPYADVIAERAVAATQEDERASAVSLLDNLARRE